MVNGKVVDVKLDTGNGFTSNNAIKSDIYTENFAKEESKVETELNLDTKSLGVKGPEYLTKNANDKDNESMAKCKDTKNKSIVIIKLSKSQLLNYYKSKSQLESKDRMFTCIICKCKTNKIQQHLVVHTGEKSLECNECGHKSAYKYDMVKHKKLHLATKFFKCSKTSPQGSLKQHIHIIKTMSVIKKKPIQMAETYKCEKCSYHTLFKSSFDLHNLKTHNQVTESINGHKIFKCSWCCYSTSHRYRLQRHVIEHKEKYFSCKFCQYKSTENHHLKRHIMVKHTKESLLKCNQCYFKCFYKGSMLNHKKKHANGGHFWCRECNYRTSVQANFDMHIHNIKPDCPTPSIPETLQIIKQNTKPSKYLQCSKCDYRTVVKANFDMHTHNMEHSEKLTLEKCGKNVNKTQTHDMKQAQNLPKKHYIKKSKRIIKNNKRVNVKHFQCLNCNYTTTMKENFVKHIHNVEQMEIEPTVIPMEVTSRKNKSSKKSTRKKPSIFKNSFGCSICGYKTTVKANFDLHVHDIQASGGNLRNEDEIKMENFDARNVTCDEYNKTDFFYPSECEVQSEIKTDYDRHDYNSTTRPDYNFTEMNKMKVENSGGEGTSTSQLLACSNESTKTTYFNIQGHNIKQEFNENELCEANKISYTNSNQNLFCSADQMQMNVLNSPGFMYFINPIQIGDQQYFYQFINSSVDSNYSQF